MVLDRKDKVDGIISHPEIAIPPRPKIAILTCPFETPTPKTKYNNIDITTSE